METYTCIFCSKQLVLKDKYTKSGHLAKCSSFKEKKTKELTKDFLISEYIDKGKSAMQIAEEFGLPSSSAINNLLILYEIKKRSISESKKQDKCKERLRKTNQERYGVDHNLESGSPCRKKMIQDLVERYGIVNVFQREDVILKIKERGRFASIHKTICEILEQNSIGFDIEFYIKHPSGKYYLFDIRIKDSNKLIEVNGDYWHASPRLYKPDDIFRGGILSKDIWKKDKEKIDCATLLCYDVLVLWEQDIKTRIDEVKIQIHEFIYNEN